MQKKKNNLKITLSDNQASVIEAALDFYVRCRMGQFDEIGRLFPDKYQDSVVRGLLDRLHIEILDMPPNASHGIHGLPEEFKMACDLKHVIRYHLSYQRNPSGSMTVNFDTPDHYSSEPLAKVEDDLTDDARLLLKNLRDRVRWRQEKKFDAYEFVTKKGHKLVTELISKGYLKQSEKTFELRAPESE